MEAALKGIDTLLLISSSVFGKRVEHHTNTINAAKRSRVKWIVYTSLLHAHISTISLAAERGHRSRAQNLGHPVHVAAERLVLREQDRVNWWSGQTYELAGDDAYTLTDLAAEISRQTGKNLPYLDMPAAEYARALEGHGLPDWLAATIADWDVATAGGALYSTDRTLSRLIGRPTTALPVSVAEALEAAM